jgi:hypothetical protein
MLMARLKEVKVTCRLIVVPGLITIPVQPT